MPLPTGTKLETFEHLPSVGEVLSMQREMSAATSENEVLLPFLRRFRQFFGATHALSLLTEGLDAGAYRMMCAFDLDPSSISMDRLEADSRWKLPIEQTPPVRTSIISELVARAVPCVIRGVTADDDPTLAGMFGGERDLIGIPIYMLGEATESVVVVIPSGQEICEQDIAVGVANLNLMIQGLMHLRTSRELAAMHTKLDAQMQEIGRVQRSLLPSAWPAEQAVEVVTSYEPSEAAGGDYFDFRTFPNPDGGEDRIGVVIADVSGHGPVAAVTMAIFRTAMAATVLYTTDPERTVPDVNAMIFDSVEPGTFVTAFLMVLDQHTGRVGVRCCGHNPPRLRRASGAVESIDTEGCPPLGVVPELEVVGDSFTMNPGDTLVLYTDGITEAFSPEGELFGTERLDAAISAGQGDPTKTKHAILDAVREHANGRPRDDDQTLVVLRFNGVRGS